MHQKFIYFPKPNQGELYFSDVYSDRRLPSTAREHAVLVGECVGGALYIDDFIRLCRETGFSDPRVLSIRQIDVRAEGDDDGIEMLAMREISIYALYPYTHVYTLLMLVIDWDSMHSWSESISLFRYFVHCSLRKS